MFKGLSDGFLRMLSLEIKPSLYLPRQIIADRNEICHNMYYIQRGEVDVSIHSLHTKVNPSSKPKAIYYNGVLLSLGVHSMRAVLGYGLYTSEYQG